MQTAIRDALVRHRAGDPTGLVESFFLKANALDGPRAFWIKFTVLSPAGRPADATGDVWAIVFDRTAGAPVAAKQSFPLEACALGRASPGFEAPGARLQPGATRGRVAARGHEIEWDLRFAGDAPPLHLFPSDALYETEAFPRFKLLTPMPDARFEGVLRVDGREVAVRAWPGCFGHNWGRAHANRYAWAHANAFEGHEGTYFEGVSARLQLGPVITPYFTLIYLRHRGRTYDFRGLPHWFNRSASVDPSRWSFVAESRLARLRGEVVADPRDTAGLVYQDPDGARAHCLNSKLATCRLELALRSGRRFEPAAVLEAPGRAALEVLVRDEPHGIPILA